MKKEQLISGIIAFAAFLLFSFSVFRFGASLAAELGTKGPDASKRKHVSVMLGIDFQRATIEKQIAEFNKEHPEIDVEMIWVPAKQYETKLKTLIAAGQAPDLIYCGDVWVAYLLPFLYDVTPFVERDAKEVDLDDLYPEIRQACQYKGRYYFMPRWFNISLLYYNKKIFDDAKEPYPKAEWTWEDYVKAGQRLTKIGPNGKVDIWGSNLTAGWWGEWLILVRQCGGDFFNSEMTRCLLDSPEAVAGMRFYSDLVHKYKIAPPPGRAPDNDFASGMMAMDFGGHTQLWKVYNSVKGLDWDIQILPRGPKSRNGGEVALDALGISKTTRDPESAWQLLKFFGSKKAIRMQVEAGYLSIRKSVAEELLFAPGRDVTPKNIRAAYEALKYAERIPQSPDFIEVALDQIQPEFDLMLEKGSDPAEACRKAAESANTFLKVIGKQKADGAERKGGDAK